MALSRSRCNGLRPAIVVSFLALTAASPALAEDPGAPYLVRNIDRTGEPFFIECDFTCPPPTPIYGSLIEQLTPLGDLLVFVANDRIHGFEPWVSDGTAAGTRLLADTCTGECPEYAPTLLGVLDDRLFFTAPLGTAEGSALWVTDGTPGGTRALTELCPELCDVLIEGPGLAFEGALFFQAYQADPAPRGRHLWRTDGTVAGTAKILPVCGNPSCGERFHNFFEYRGRLFFNDWAGMRRIDAPGAPAVQFWSGEPVAAAPLGFRMVLALGGSIPSLWVMNGAVADPELVTHVGGDGLSQLTSAGDLVYFVRHASFRYELWRTDGTAAGTAPVAPEIAGAGVDVVGVLDGHPIVRVVPDQGSAPGAPTLLRIDPAGAEALSTLAIQSVVVLDDLVFFSAESEGDRDRELWVSDGTAAGTALHADIAPGAASSQPGLGGRHVAGFARAGRLLFFPAHHPDVDTELWALDLGTDDGPGDGPPPPPPSTEWLESDEVPGFRVQVRITGGGPSILGRMEPACIPETLCVSGALPGRSEVFVRVVGPKPNGFLWPTLVKFSTSTVEVWIEQGSTGVVRYYELEGASPGVDELPGLFDRMGFSS